MVDHDKIAHQLAGDFVNEVLGGKSNLLSFCKGAVFTVMSMVHEMKEAVSDKDVRTPIKFFSVAQSRSAAIDAAHSVCGWEGKIQNVHLNPDGIDTLDEWDARFTCGGDGMRAGGSIVNGVYFLTWWK